MVNHDTKSNCVSKNLNQTRLTLYLTIFLKNSPVILVVATKKAHKYKTTQDILGRIQNF